MAIEYLGNKTQLLDFVVRPIAAERKAVIADVFCGTASVSRALAERGMRVLANDHLRLCATMAEATLLASGEPPFAGLKSELARRGASSAYTAVIETLNELAPRSGFIHTTYSPASAATGVRRMYLTEDNAGRVDAIRAQIEEWTPALTRVERAILLRDLVRAVSLVSNTAGTYGCYLKTWKRRALEPLRLEPKPTATLPTADHQVSCEDAETFTATLRADLVYLDPPYTKRQYAAYYHLLETLVRGDEPQVTGSTGLPDWRRQQSDFCYRKYAPTALKQLVECVDATGVFLSYSEDGHIEHEEIISILESRGHVRWWEQELPRYRSSSLGHRGPCVQERLYHLSISSRVAPPRRRHTRDHTRTPRRQTTQASR